MRKAVQLLIGCSLLLSLFAGCGRCCNNCYRRPPVMAEWRPYVLDYNDICADYGDYVEGFYEEERAPLTDDMFDPYQPIDPDYKLAIGDILELSIFGDDDNHIQNCVVAPDGKVYFSIITEGVKAEGLTTQELGHEMSSKLTHLYVDPTVIVAPLVTLGQSVKILGRVRSPGIIPLQGPLTIREAIGMTGGLYDEASKINDQSNDLTVEYEDLSRSFIVRGDKKLDVDFEQLLTSGDNSQNVYLRPGDYIYVAPAENVDIYILGAVLAPQRLAFTKGMTLMQALTYTGTWMLPGPYTPDYRRVLVIRGSLDCPCVVEIDAWQIVNGEALDLYLQPGDIVYAPSKNMRLGRELIYIAIETFIQAFISTGAGYYSGSQWFF